MPSWQVSLHAVQDSQTARFSGCMDICCEYMRQYTGNGGGFEGLSLPLLAACIKNRVQSAPIVAVGCCLQRVLALYLD
eukprot:scaffold169479_cov18-Tisochrysis_lutea.AAC.2